MSFPAAAAVHRLCGAVHHGGAEIRSSALPLSVSHSAFVVLSSFTFTLSRDSSSSRRFILFIFKFIYSGSLKIFVFFWKSFKELMMSFASLSRLKLDFCFIWTLYWTPSESKFMANTSFVCMRVSFVCVKTEQERRESKTRDEALIKSHSVLTCIRVLHADCWHTYVYEVCWKRWRHCDVFQDALSFCDHRKATKSLVSCKVCARRQTRRGGMNIWVLVFTLFVVYIYIYKFYNWKINKTGSALHVRLKNIFKSLITCF